MQGLNVAPFPKHGFQVIAQSIGQDPTLRSGDLNVVVYVAWAIADTSIVEQRKEYRYLSRFPDVPETNPIRPAEDLPTVINGVCGIAYAYAGDYIWRSLFLLTVKFVDPAVVPVKGAIFESAYSARVRLLN